MESGIVRETEVNAASQWLVGQRRFAMDGRGSEFGDWICTAGIRLLQIGSQRWIRERRGLEAFLLIDHARQAMLR